MEPLTFSCNPYLASLTGSLIEAVVARNKNILDLKREHVNASFSSSYRLQNLYKLRLIKDFFLNILGFAYLKRRKCKS